MRQYRLWMYICYGSQKEQLRRDLFIEVWFGVESAAHMGVLGLPGSDVQTPHSIAPPSTISGLHTIKSKDVCACRECRIHDVVR